MCILFIVKSDYVAKGFPQSKPK